MDNWATRGDGETQEKASRGGGGADVEVELEERTTTQVVWCMVRTAIARVSLGRLFPRMRGALFHIGALPLELPTRPCRTNHCPSLGLRNS